MRNRTRKVLVSLSAVGLLAGPAAGSAIASTQTADGLVNVQVGDVTVQDVNVGVAAAIAAEVCGVDVGPVAVLGTAVDATGRKAVICRIEDGKVTLKQN